MLDRLTGKPLITVEERAVPKSDIPGEDAAPSQPIPAWSAMVPQKLTAEDAWGPTPEMRKWCQEKMASYRNDGLFTPPTFKGTIAFPGNIGGVNWGGAAWDPVRNLLLANTNRVAAVAKLIPREDMPAATAERRGNEVGRRVRAAARHALRHASGLAGVAVAAALQRAAVGRAGGLRSEHRQAALGIAAGQHGRGLRRPDRSALADPWPPPAG